MHAPSLALQFFRFLFCLWRIIKYNSWSPKPFQPPSAGSGSIYSSISGARRTSATGIYFCIYAFCRPRVNVYFASFLPASFPVPSVYCYVLYLPRYFVLYLRFVRFPLPFISSLPILSSQLFAFRALVLHSLHAYSNVLLVM